MVGVFVVVVVVSTCLVMLSGLRWFPTYFPFKNIFQNNQHDLRNKIDSIVRKNDSVPDPDAPSCPESVRFWCTTGGWYHEKEKHEVKAKSSMAITSNAANLGGMCALSGGAPGGPLAVASDAAAAPSLTALVDVMNGNPAGTGGSPPTATSKAKGKAKAKAKLQLPKSNKEKRDAARS